MKVVAISVFAYLSLIPGALAYDDSNHNPMLLWEIKELALKCVVQPYHFSQNGKKILEPLMSVCRELQVYARGATLVVRGERLHAELKDAEQSDGGDLDDLEIYTVAGHKIAERKNVASFNNVFVALAGGTTDFRQLRRK